LEPDNAAISFAVNGPFLFAGMNRYGVWKRPLSEMVVSVTDQRRNHLPQEYRLEQNYPNPFNPITTITYTLPRTSSVTLKICDILGREIVTLVAGTQGPGYRSVQFNASGLPSGIYFCRLQAGAFTDTKKVLVVR
jgi:hypothetical protein